MIILNRRSFSGEACAPNSPSSLGERADAEALPVAFAALGASGHGLQDGMDLW
jgi:hypothetical protein